MHLADRNRHPATLHGNTQQGACRNDMPLGRILAEILQGVEGFLTFLYFIEYQQGLARYKGDIAVERQLLDDP